ncbi:hypothetical protein I7I51_02157 [Histoplasma capsulatum]|uniref:Uncharacterized protein n=1 Tax=Ajellomyces capsulatus TaxID=5037 RepID=A0A8A1MB13_AJECA|nr:hypothetical protein I7I51_02157 [Histoplasma capsulatum]
MFKTFPQKLIPPCAPFARILEKVAAAAKVLLKNKSAVGIAPASQTPRDHFIVAIIIIMVILCIMYIREINASDMELSEISRTAAAAALHRSHHGPGTST